MSDNYFKSIYKLLKNLSTIHTSGRYKIIQQYNLIIKCNEILLNEITKYMILGTLPHLVGGGFDEQLDQIQLDLGQIIEDFINKCKENNEGTVKILKSLLKYIDFLYSTVKDVDINKIKNQIAELNEIFKSLE